MNDNCKLRWDSSFEKIILNFRKKISKLKNIHISLSKSKHNSYSNLMLSIIIIAPSTGLISGVGSVYKHYENLFLLSSSFLNILSGIILSIVKFNKYDELSSEHKNSAMRYTYLEHNIEQQLALPKTDRIEAVKYINYLNDEFSLIYTSSPFVDIDFEVSYDEDEDNFLIKDDDNNDNNDNKDNKDKNNEVEGISRNDIMYFGILNYELERFKK